MPSIHRHTWFFLIYQSWDIIPLQKCIPVMLKLVLKKGFIILQSLRRSITVGKNNKKLELVMLYVA